MITFTPIPKETVTSLKTKKGKTKTSKKIKNDNSNPFVITPVSHDNLTEEQIEKQIFNTRQLLSKLTQLKIKKQNVRVQEEIKKLRNKKTKNYQINTKKGWYKKKQSKKVA